MAAISTSLKTGLNHNMGLFTKGHGGVLDRHHYSGPSGGSHHHHYDYYPSKGKHKRSVALSALTLLAFLFFLNILQNCIQDHMDQMQTPGVIVVTTPAPTALISRYREAEEQDIINISRVDKNVDKLTKRGKMSNAHTNNKQFKAN